MNIKTFYHLAQYLMNRQAQSQSTPEREPAPVKPLDQADAVLAMAFMNDDIVVETPELIEEVKAVLS